MTTYQQIIAKATGVQDIATLAEIEESMRQDVFNSTLDWQTRAQLVKGAKQAYEIVKYLRRVAALEAQGMTTSDAQGVIDAQDRF